MNNHLTTAVRQFNAKSNELIPHMGLTLTEDDFADLVRQPRNAKEAKSFIDEIASGKGEYTGGMATVILALI